MHSLKQAGKIVYNNLKQHLVPHRYVPIQFTSDL